MAPPRSLMGFGFGVIYLALAGTVSASKLLRVPPTKASHNSSANGGNASLDAATSNHVVGQLLHKLNISGDIPDVGDHLPNVTTLLDSMENAVMSAHNLSQSSINSLHGNISTCSLSSNGTLSAYLLSYSSNLAQHRHCRQDEAALKRDYDACETQKSQARIIMDAKKELYDAVNGRATPESDCAFQGADEERGHYLERLTGWFAGQYELWTSRKSDFEAAEAAYNELDCDSRKDSSRNMKVDCDRILETIQHSSCSYVQGHASQCQLLYSSCYLGKVSAYEAAIGTATAEADGRKLQWRAIKRIRCMLPLFGNGTSSALDACLSAAPANADHFDIVHPAVPEPETCEAPAKYPCSKAYVDEVYSDLPTDIEYPECSPCAIPGTSTTEEPVEPVAPAWESVAWAKLSPSGSSKPGSRRHHRAVWDAQDGSMLVFGGYPTRQDLWRYKASSNSWEQLIPSGSKPPAMYANSVVWDQERRIMLVFGGSSNTNDLWRYTVSSNSWEKLSPTGSKPAARTSHSAVWDADSKSMLVFGGWVSDQANDLWRYSDSNNTWEELRPTGSVPAGRAQAMAVWDAASKSMLVFGGDAKGRGFVNDLWRYKLTSNTWEELSPDGSKPVGRCEGTAVWDAPSRSMLIFGGYAYVNDLWRYKDSSSAWEELNPAGSKPSARYGHCAAWDAKNRSMHVFSGSTGSNVNDFWRLAVTVAA